MPASPRTARTINDRVALRLLESEGPLTAGQLKQLTGLSRPSVADLVERLADSGLISVVGESGESRRGPNARLYGIVADRAHLAALDVRTGGVTVVVSDLLGTVLAEDTLPIGPDTGTAPAVARAVQLVEDTARRAGAGPLHSVGIGAPGLVDPVSGELRDTTGLPAWHRGLVGALQDRLPARVIVGNETNIAALAEQREGAGHDRESFVLLWLGHGVGAALVLDGVLRRGASGGAGELGFLPVPGTTRLPSGTNCEGGFHSLACSAAIAELALAHGLTASAADHEPAAAGYVRAAVHGVTGQGPAAVRGATAQETADHEGADHEGAGPFLDELADRIALGVAAVTAVLDPGCVVLGGEVGQAGGPELAGRVGERLAGLSPLATEVRAGVLGGGAVLRGALFTARDAAQEELFSTASGVPR